MKKIFKIFLVIIIFVCFLTSILYGLRIKDTLYEYEYLTNSLVVTIPNKLWFETNSQQDYLLKDQTTSTYIFSDNLLEYTKSGYNIGYIYPTYTAKIANDAVDKTDIVTREKNSLDIDRNIKIQNPSDYDYYVSKLALSEFGSYANNTFTQEGCSINISSQNGVISYEKEASIILVSYMINGNTNIDDHINITIECKK